MTASLKKQNLAILIPYAIWCLSLYAVFLTGDDNSWQNIVSFFDYFSIREGMLAALVPIIVFVLSSILSADIKSVIVFWRIKNPLPGSRVFTVLGFKDARIDMSEIERIVGSLPTDPKEQNAVWYKYYKKYQDSLTVKAAHKHFLLGRDMAAMTLLLLIFLPCSVAAISRNWLGAFIYLGILFGQYILLTIVARNHGNRFVCNVLTEMCV